MEDLERSRTASQVPISPSTPASITTPGEAQIPRRRRGDTSSRLLEGFLPTDLIKTEESMTVTSYLTILEDLALRYRINVAIAKGFDSLETPRKDGSNNKKFIDLWPIQMSAELSADGKNILTTNFDTCKWQVALICFTT
jgi:potassium/chloride transporter 9